MKIGKFYEDYNTGELLMCHNFTYSYYVWVDVKGQYWEEDKPEAWKHMSSTASKDKDKINEFINTHNFYIRTLCKKCGKAFVSRFIKYVDEQATGEETCSNCKICV